MAGTYSPEALLKSGLVELFTSKEFADFTITCGADIYKVHKAVLAARSEYFLVACRCGLKEGESHAIDLKVSESDPTCDDPEAVKHMVNFFYHLDYAAVSVLTHAKFFAAAVKYQIPALRYLAAEKFKKAVNKHAGGTDFAKAIQVAYSTTGGEVRELRDVVVDTLSSESALCEDVEICEVVCSINGLSWGLFKKSKGKPVPTKTESRYHCRRCNRPDRFNLLFNGYCLNCASFGTTRNSGMQRGRGGVL